MSFLDTLGTLVGVSGPGAADNLRRPMLVDAVACTGAALVGTSTSGAFIESAAGVRAGARTGLAAVTTGLLFATSLFFLPLTGPLQGLSFVYAPALVAVGGLMLGGLRQVNFEDPAEAMPAAISVALVALTYNIANGLAAGLVLWPLLRLASGRWREVPIGSVALGLGCAAYFARGVTH